MISIKRFINMLLLALVYIRMNVFGLIYSLYILITGKGSPYYFIHSLAAMMEPRYTCIKGSHKANGGKTMYLVNHRSWADFFVDGDMISNVSYLSRMAVIIAFPGASIGGYLLQFIWFFKRQAGISRDWLTTFFKENWAVRPDNGVIVYPEGHRYKGEGTLSLKTGVMEVSYNLQVPCQIVMSNGKENLMDEINLTINKNSLVTIYVSEVLDPTKFENKEAWFEYVKKQWIISYEKLNAGDSDGTIFNGPLPGIKPETLTLEKLPQGRRLQVASYLIAAISVIVVIVKLIF